jgi:4-hydroxybenzoate polyprenyltransferase
MSLSASPSELSLTSTSMSLRSFAWACFRLGRFHTLMGYVIFTVPASQSRYPLYAKLSTHATSVLTVILYHAANVDKYPNPIQRASDLILRVFICILSHRGAGLCWDVRFYYFGSVWMPY